MERERCALAGLAIAVCLVAASPAAGTGSVTGNPATIAFYKHVVAAYRNVPALTYTVHGNFWYTANGNAFTYYDGSTHPATAKTATQSNLALLSGGLVTKLVITASRPGLPSVTIIQDMTGTWAALQNHPGACFLPQSPQAIGATVHKPFLQLNGDYLPLRQEGSDTLVTSTFRWGQTGTATEVDTIADATKTLVSSRFTVRGPEAHTFTISYQNLASAPGLVLVPEPHC